MGIGSESVIDVHGATVRMGGRVILENVSFEVKRGENITIIGPNGAGKTTLLKVIGGLIPLSSGEIHLAGRNLRDYRRQEIARQIAYVAQSAGLMCACTAFEFVLMGRYAHYRRLGGISEQDKVAAREALDVTGTAPFADRALKTLSGGERQKVLIAAALAQAAPILLLDEPSTFLDYRHAAEVTDLIEKLNREGGLTVLTVSHDLNRGALECDRVFALDRGRIIFSGSPDDLAHPGVLQNIYNTPLDLIEHPQGQAKVVVALRRPV